MTHKIVRYTLPAALAPSGSFTIGYPAGTNPGTFANGKIHRIATANGDVYKAPYFFTLTFGSSTITVNWNSTSPTIPIGTPLFIQLSAAGSSPQSVVESGAPALQNTVGMSLKYIDFGAPLAASATAVCAAQAIAGAADALINGGLAVNGEAFLDLDRSLQFVSSNAGDTTQSVTVYSVDRYGNKLIETVALNGTTVVHGVKAHRGVTRVHVSAALAGNLSVGSDTKLGLPAFVNGAGNVIKELLDGAVVTNGTFTGGSMSTPSATTNDVRGLYAPNTAPNGTHTYTLFVALPDPNFIGLDQYAG